MSAYLCVDAGTTLIKSVVFSESGEQIAISHRPSPLLTPRPGWVEQSMRSVLDAVIATVREAASSSPEPIGLLSITAQGDGFWPVGPSDEPAGDAILWNDGRASGVIDRWTADGTLESAFRVNGSLGNKGLPHAIMRHLLDDGRGLDGVDAVLTCGSWLFLALTGTRGLHVSEASAPWLDVHTGTKSDELLQIYGLSAHAGLIPDVLDGERTVQPLRAELAAATGLRAGIPVVMAPYDVVTTALGSGSVADGDAFCILGTTLCTGVVQSRTDTTGTPSGLTLLTSQSGLSIRAFPTLAGTGVVDWLSRLLGLADAAAVTSLAEQSPPGANGVLVWPYLSGAGERAPFLDGAARGVIGNLDFGHGPADIARGCLEGLAYVIRECTLSAGTSTSELALSGGGSASRLWCQIVADVTGTPAVRSSDSQIGAKGAMIAAAVATGRYPDVRAAARELVAPAEIFTPDAAATALYDERYDAFLRTRTGIANHWNGWGGRGDR